MGVEVGVDAGVIVGWAVDVKAKGEVGEGDDFLRGDGGFSFGHFIFHGA